MQALSDEYTQRARTYQEDTCALMRKYTAEQTASRNARADFLDRWTARCTELIRNRLAGKLPAEKWKVVRITPLLDHDTCRIEISCEYIRSEAYSFLTDTNLNSWSWRISIGTWALCMQNKSRQEYHALIDDLYDMCELLNSIDFQCPGDVAPV